MVVLRQWVPVRNGVIRTPSGHWGDDPGSSTAGTKGVSMKIQNVGVWYFCILKHFVSYFS